jgi:hypothetical protein
MDHFEQVHEIIKARGWVLGRERKDSYVNDLFKFMKPGNRKHLIVERMLFAAMIEARSCERFKVLSDNIKDEELAVFYRELMISEANHYTSFLQFAQQNPAGNPSDYAVDYTPQGSYVAQQNPNMGITPAMKMMMESIAKTMAEQTIKKVLTDFTETQKNKTFYEVYNKEKSIVKTADGKLYKLTPVQIKR